MAIKLHVMAEYNTAVLVHAGTTPDEEFLAFYKSFYERDSIDKSMNLVVDLRDADSRQRSTEVLHQFAEFIQGALADATLSPKVAVVAPKDLSFGLARMYEAFADSVPWDFVVFRDIDAALAWLGLPNDLMDHCDKDVQQDNQG